MGLKYSIEGKDQYLHVCCSGVFQHMEMRECRNQVLNVCKNDFTAVDKILFDVRRVLGGMSLFERYEYAFEFSEAYFQLLRYRPIPIQFGCIGHPPTIDTSGFEETVFKNRGVAMKISSELSVIFQWMKIDEQLVG